MRHKPVFTISGSHTVYGWVAEKDSTCGPYNRILAFDNIEIFSVVNIFCLPTLGYDRSLRDIRSLLSV
jgi:hypothetical protein